MTFAVDDKARIAMLEKMLREQWAIYADSSLNPEQRMAQLHVTYAEQGALGELLHECAKQARSAALANTNGAAAAAELPATRSPGEEVGTPFESASRREQDAAVAPPSACPHVAGCPVCDEGAPTKSNQY
jgi:hypothetical protein